MSLVALPLPLYAYTDIVSLRAQVQEILNLVYRLPSTTNAQLTTKIQLLEQALKLQLQVNALENQQTVPYDPYASALPYAFTYAPVLAEPLVTNGYTVSLTWAAPVGYDTIPDYYTVWRRAGAGDFTMLDIPIAPGSQPLMLQSCAVGQTSLCWTLSGATSGSNTNGDSQPKSSGAYTYAVVASWNTGRAVISNRVRAVVGNSASQDYSYNAPLRITYPASGVRLMRGQTYAVTWTGSDGGATRSYSVFLAGGSLGIMGSRFLGSVDIGTQNYYVLNIPYDVSPGSGYQIQFSGASTVGATSESFTIN